MSAFKALKTFKTVSIVALLALLSNFEICAFCTPTSSPNCSCVNLRSCLVLFLSFVLKHPYEVRIHILGPAFFPQSFLPIYLSFISVSVYDFIAAFAIMLFFQSSLSKYFFLMLFALSISLAGTLSTFLINPCQQKPMFRFYFLCPKRQVT